MPDQDTPQFVTHSEFHTFVSEQRAFNTRLLDKIDEIATGNPTNWGWVLASIIALGSFIALYVQPVKEAAGRDRQAVQYLANEFENHRDRDGHPAMTERGIHLASLIEKNTEAIEQMDSVLQREMRLLDEILQREMGLHVDRINDRLAAIEKQISKLDEMRDNRFTLDMGILLSERVRTLELGQGSGEN
jgi:hypothetical protein